MTEPAAGSAARDSTATAFSPMPITASASSARGQFSQAGEVGGGAHARRDFADVADRQRARRRLRKRRRVGRAGAKMTRGDDGFSRRARRRDDRRKFARGFDFDVDRVDKRQHRAQQIAAPAAVAKNPPARPAPAFFARARRREDGQARGGGGGGERLSECARRGERIEAPQIEADFGDGESFFARRDEPLARHRSPKRSRQIRAAGAQRKSAEGNHRASAARCRSKVALQTAPKPVSSPGAAASPPLQVDALMSRCSHGIEAGKNSRKKIAAWM